MEIMKRTDIAITLLVQEMDRNGNQLTIKDIPILIISELLRVWIGPEDVGVYLLSVDGKERVSVTWAPQRGLA
jgi:hypothetical protein